MTCSKSGGQAELAKVARRDGERFELCNPVAQEIRAVLVLGRVTSMCNSQGRHGVDGGTMGWKILGDNSLSFREQNGKARKEIVPALATATLLARVNRGCSPYAGAICTHKVSALSITYHSP